jgi:hypothetical protein
LRPFGLCAGKPKFGLGIPSADIHAVFSAFSEQDFVRIGGLAVKRIRWKMTIIITD